MEGSGEDISASQSSGWSCQHVAQCMRHGANPLLYDSCRDAAELEAGELAKQACLQTGELQCVHLQLSTGND